MIWLVCCITQLRQLSRNGERTGARSRDGFAHAAPELDGYHYLWDKCTLYGKLHVGKALPLPELFNPNTVAKAEEQADRFGKAQDVLPKEFRDNNQAEARPLLPEDLPSVLGKRKA